MFHFAPQNAARAAGTRKAKIVCTLGPASSSDAVVTDLLRNGMNVARLNFSHGTHEEHARRIEQVRRLAAREGLPVAILQDLQGPKIRTGRLKDRRELVLRKGDRLKLTPRDVAGTSELISVSFPALAKEVTTGERILLSDGLIELVVRKIRGGEVECEVLSGGLLKEHQGVNLPGAVLGVPSLTEKDRKDLEFGLSEGVDWVALSFVRTAADVREIKRLIGRRGGMPPVIAKLEKPQAIEHLDEILETADAVMVARGDLGVEMQPELVPVVQKEIIRRAFEWRKPVITATQMLESMIEHPRPTRAEASDVANAVFDGTDAVMLSGETASGKFPREAVAFMARIVEQAEAHMGARISNGEPERLSIPETICESVAHAASKLNMRAIAVFTESGTTARLVSKYRPTVPIYAFAPDERVSNWMNLLWGVRPMHSEPAVSAELMLRLGQRELLARGAVSEGDVIGTVVGTRLASGSTNVMLLHVVGSEARATTTAVGAVSRDERRRVPRLKTKTKTRQR